MKSTRVFKILSIALAAAVVFYFLVQGVRYLTNPYATTRVYTSTTEDAVEASGWLVREEENEEPMSNARFKTEQIPALVSARMNGLTTSEWCRQRVQKCPQTGL